MNFEKDPVSVKLSGPGKNYLRPTIHILNINFANFRPEIELKLINFVVS
jgi:hypothetical protein